LKIALVGSLVTDDEEWDTINQITPAFVGICGTDLHEYLGGPTFCPAHPHPVTGETIPVTLGHEFSGTIKEVGPGVDKLKVGQKCTVQPLIVCGECPACKVGAYNICHTVGFVGLSGQGGGLSDAVCVRADRVFPLPDSVPLHLGALVEPLSVAWHAIEAAPDLDPDSFVLVIGGGPIGLAIVLCLRAKGVTDIMVSEVAAARRNYAAQFGAKWVVDPTDTDVVADVNQKTNGTGADVTIDCAGVPQSIECACTAVKTFGTIINVAIWEKGVSFNPNWLTFRETAYKSVLAYRDRDFASVIEGLSTGEHSLDSAIAPEGMITSKIKLEDLVERGFQSLIKDRETQVKILVDLSL
ncbi:Alcohol dehydrogenase GroES-like domain, partial [Geosmithia morbida]